VQGRETRLKSTKNNDGRMEKSLGPASGGKTILIVDDELGIVEVLEFILADAGFTIVSALNGQEALVRLKQATPAVVLLDLMMPVLDGAAVLKRMRDDPQYSAIPVILTSALPENTVRTKCDGYNLFIRKPFKSQQILDAIAGFIAPNCKPAE
jgi:CheY-like chemotaxis protein